MALLQKAGEVDASAQDFVDLLEGVADYIAGGARAIRMRSHAPDAANEPLENFAHEHGVDPARRWCTECLVLGAALDRDGLRAALTAIDVDSVVIAGGVTRLRVHTHLGEPQRLFDACAARGCCSSAA